ncbi:WD40 repeat domain-containing protein [Falsiroseomonas selenitidurans]|uniref:WD40 repeat domain-containing protein n=1 Tax=Falsiroseomonas selenitidurans TaxID=2716335 RepID=A0ABX1E9H6_9PROT|nr:WD40 repeat domain-containing protein [Falsiroseomonas selenitidurans]NKC33849.1 WD40 repeat domain-containing protein [Falsiroseomonas selenitidurans]
MAEVSEADFLLASRGEAWELGAWVVAALHDRQGRPGFALADGTLRIGATTVQAHDGAILSACADATEGFLTGGDDGQLVHTAPDGTTTRVQKFGSKWVDHVAAHESGLRAASAGKVAHVLDAKGAVLKSLTHPSSVGGLAFDAKGKRLAASHYGGASLWFVGAKEDKPRVLEWKGSHHGIAFSPDGSHVVTAMQETALHGWRLADGQHMRMSGYPAKTHSLSFTGRGRWLATSGAESVVLWPFFGGGPMGKAPTELAGGDEVLCTAVACHPQHEVVAAGFGDGLVLMAEIASGKVVPVAPPRGTAVTSLSWNATGSSLAFGTEGGFAGTVDLAKR